MYIHISYIFVTTINKTRHKFEGKQGGLWEGFGERKERDVIKL